MTDTEFSGLATNRVRALHILVSSAGNIGNADDYGDMLGALRLTELAAQQTRNAIIREARAAGDSWEKIADALGCSVQYARRRFE